MNRIVVGGAVLVTLLLAGCGSASQEPVSWDRGIGQEGASSMTKDPRPRSGPEYIRTDIGERAGAVCPGDTVDSCELIFTVTDIDIDFECPAKVWTEVPEGHRVVRVAMEAEMKDEISVEPSWLAFNLHASNWGIIDPDGYYSNNPEAQFCSEDSWDFLDMGVGTKVRGARSIMVPDGTPVFRINSEQGEGGWEWDIPW